jgi:hypothetical protein
MRKTRNPRPSQLRLFHPPTKMPTWAGLRGEVQQNTIRLLSQLLRQYWETHHGVLHSEEAGHE